MRTRASRMVLICSTAVLVMLLWAGMAAAKPTPHKWSQHHRAEAKIAQQSPSEDQSDDSARSSTAGSARRSSRCRGRHPRPARRV